MDAAGRSRSVLINVSGQSHQAALSRVYVKVEINLLCPLSSGTPCFLTVESGFLLRQEVKQNSLSLSLSYFPSSLLENTFCFTNLGLKLEECYLIPLDLSRFFFSSL